jgi:hypothetical protein
MTSEMQRSANGNKTLAAVESKGQQLSPKELGLLARKLANTSDNVEAARLKERLTRGFYGI